MNKISYLVLILISSLVLLANTVESKLFGQDGLTLFYDSINAADFPKIVSLVTVTNDSGYIIGKLDTSHFKVWEDSIREYPIQVEELTVDTAGVNVVLTIDRSGSMRDGPIADARSAAITFVELMQDNDNSAVVSFNHLTRTDYPFSNNTDSLTNAIAKIQAGGGTSIFDALIHSADLFRNVTKKRAIILLTDGADKDSRYTLEEALRTLIPREIPVFTIGLGLNHNSPEEQVLRQIANETGGRYYYSPSSSDLEEIYRAISMLLHHRYKVTYSTHNPAKDGTRRHVEIGVQVLGQASSDTSSYIAPYEPPPIDPPPVDPPADPPVEVVFEVLPNPFTPNDDGYNDRVEFRQSDGNPPHWVITIMDRAGSVVRRLANGERFWDGRDESGQRMLPGSYLYVVSQGDEALHRGLVQLVR